MIFRQLFDQTSHTYTYLLAERRGGEALLIDPVLENTAQYVRLLEELDVKLVLAADTHIHADHVTALGSLREQTGCASAMGAMTHVQSVSRYISMRVKNCVLTTFTWTFFIPRDIPMTPTASCYPTGCSPVIHC